MFRSYTALLLALLATAAAAQEEEPVATLSRARVPAVGRQETILRVSRFGRYAILVKAAQGTALRLLYRVALAIAAIDFVQRQGSARHRRRTGPRAPSARRPS